MLKNTKIAVAFAAFSLMSVAAIAPLASAIPINNNPYVDIEEDEVAAGDTVVFDVWDVRAGCTVTTTLGSRKVVDKSVDYDLTTNGKAGAVEDAEIKAPAAAGEYTMRSAVSSTCKNDAGHKSSDTLYIGEEVFFGSIGSIDWDYESISGDSLAMRFHGAIIDYDEWAMGDGASVDTEAVKVQFWKGKRLLASGTTDADGYVSVILPGSSFKAAGEATITVKLAPNADYYISDTAQEFVITVD